MSNYLARLNALLAEKPLPQELTEPTKGASVSFVSDQGSPVLGNGYSEEIRERACLKALMAEDAPTRQADRTDTSPSVSSVSDQGRYVPSDEAAIEERGGISADKIEQRTEPAARHAVGARRLASPLDGEISDDWRERIGPLPWQPCPEDVSLERWERASSASPRPGPFKQRASAGASMSCSPSPRRQARRKRGYSVMT